MAKKISFDYESIKNRLLENLSSQSEWASFLDYGVIDNILASIANEMAYQIQYSEYNTVENFWNMARNRSSLLQISPMHGYIVPRKKSSYGTVRVSTSDTFDSSYSKNIEIPKFFQFSGGGLYVCSSEDYILNANENYVDVYCAQGEVKEVSFLAEGIQFEQKTIYDDSIDNSFFEIIVNGISYSENDDGTWNGWKNVDSLFLYDSEDRVYQVQTLPNLSGITIKFGNGIFGKKLNKNDVVKFKYISTDGSEGNIYTSDIITTVESQAFDSSGYSVKLYCTNTSSFIGGKDYPSLEEIRETSPNVYQTGDRASSKDDYTTILNDISELSKILVWGAYETLQDENEDPWGFIDSEQNVIHIAVLIGDEYDSLDELDSSTSTSIKNKIIEKLHPINDPTDLISFETTNKVPMIFHIDGKISSSSYTTSEVASNIKSNLSKKYNIKNMEFGESVYNSDFVRLIDETDGIDNHLTYVELYKDDIEFMSAYYAEFTLPIHPIDYSSIKVEIKDNSVENSEYEELATCDSNGNLVGADKTSYITTGSSINLTNGEGTLIITNGLSGDYNNYSIKVTYQYSDKTNTNANDTNIKNTNRANILYYDSAVIDLSY